MNYAEFQAVQTLTRFEANPDTKVLVWASELFREINETETGFNLDPDTGCMTLLYGYTTDRNTVHVYWDSLDVHAAGSIVFAIYDHTFNPLWVKRTDHITLGDLKNLGLKRLYPACCNFVVTMKLVEELRNTNDQFSLPFTRWPKNASKDRADRPLYGMVVHAHAGKTSEANEADASPVD